LLLNKNMPEADSSPGVRLDKWLWAARFFKTRSLAAEAINGGKIQLNGHRAKRAKQVQPGDEVRIRKGPFERSVVVVGLAEKRGSAKVAQTLYKETAESLHRQEMLAIQLKSAPETSFRTKGRPTKRERRDIDRFKRS
jgi:ribosome-associated heat shock protein Hsp15